jgi:hypothetical protein
METPNIEIGTKQISVYRWKCPVTGQPLESTQKPEAEWEFLSERGQEIVSEKEKQEWLKVFEESTAFLVSGTVEEVEPDYEELHYQMEGSAENAEVYGLVIMGSDGIKYHVSPEQGWLNIKEVSV